MQIMHYVAVRMAHFVTVTVAFSSLIFCSHYNSLQRLPFLHAAFEDIVPTAAPFRTAALEGILHNELQSLQYHDELIRAITIQNGEYIVHPSSSLDWW